MFPPGDANAPAPASPMAGKPTPRGLKNENASRPVSRVLYGTGPCGPERGSHSSGMRVAAHLKQPTRMITPEKGLGLRPASSLFGLAPGGVYLAASVAGRAVGSYPTLSPLPRRLISGQTSGLAPAIRWRGGLLSVALSLGSPPPDVIRRRLSVEPGLSSPCCLSTLQGAAARPTGALSLDHQNADDQPKSDRPTQMHPRRDHCSLRRRGVSGATDSPGLMWRCPATLIPL